MNNVFGQPPTVADFIGGRVTNPEQSEITRGSLYDYLLYPTAGVQQLAFFSQPINAAGSITTANGAVAGAPKSKWDTNLQVANTLPSGKMFNIVSIEFVAVAGSVSTANTFTPALIWNADAAALITAGLALGQAINDVDRIYQSGILELQVLDKIYTQETPLLRFPPQVAMAVDAAVATNAAGTGAIKATLGRAVGRPYIFDIPFTLFPAGNFSVNVSFPGLVPTPSGFNARVGVVMEGYFLRATQ